MVSGPGSPKFTTMWGEVRHFMPDLPDVEKMMNEHRICQTVHTAGYAESWLAHATMVQKA